LFGFDPSREVKEPAIHRELDEPIFLAQVASLDLVEEV